MNVDNQAATSVVPLHVLVATCASTAAVAAFGTYLLFSAKSKNTIDDQSKTPATFKSEKRNGQRNTGPSKDLPTISIPGPLLPPYCETKRADPYDPSPRTGYLEWDDYFMALAFLSAQRSKDPNKQVGAVIVGANKIILGIGYNGFPRGCPDASLPWAKLPVPGLGSPLDTKYPYVVHAEANALLNKNTASLTGASIYVTMFPCNECAKLLLQAGISEVIYHEAKVQIHSASEADMFSQAQAGSHSCEANGSCDHNHHHDHRQHDEHTSRCTSPEPQEDNENSSRGQTLRLVQSTTSMNGSASLAAEDACYLASQRLLSLAGVSLRQHKLQRQVILGNSS